jgi:hypothetical protein
MLQRKADNNAREYIRPVLRYLNYNDHPNLEIVLEHIQNILDMLGNNY